MEFSSKNQQDEHDWHKMGVRKQDGCYNQEEGIDYGEIYASVARIEAVKLLLAYVCLNDF